MEARQIGLLQFISGGDKRIIIPVFQRNYDWKIEHCSQLFNDIKSLINNTIKKTHFIGSIVYISNGEVDMVDLREYVIIDGQQRITTIFLLLKAIHDTASDIDEQLKNKIYEYYLINKYQNEKNKLRLKPMKEDDVVFCSIMRNELDSIDTNSNIYTNYIFFKQELSKNNLSLKEIFEATQKLLIVYISLKRGEDDPQLIFESINSTGVNLTPADLIRNFVLMDKEPYEQEELFEKYWFAIENNLSNELISDFVRDYLTMKNNKIPNKSDVYLAFKNHVINEQQPIENILFELKYFSNIYKKIIFSKTGNSRVDKLLRQLNKLKITVSYPFLLEVFYKHEQQKISDEELSKGLNIIISYVFRRLVCELQSNALNKIFANLAKEVISDIESTLSFSENLCLALLNKKYSSAFPADQEFKRNLVTKNIYSFKHRNYLLEELENYENNERVNINDLTVEHIMPQKLTNQWKASLGKNFQEIHDTHLHRLGNLTLSGDNGNLSNKTFNEKKDILLQSKLKLNKFILQYSFWTDSEINARAKDLANIALKIWEYPDIKVNNKPIIDKGYYDFDDDVDVTNMQPYLIEVFDEKIVVKSWREFFTKTIAILYDLDRNKIIQLVDDQDLHGRNSKIIAFKESDCRKPYKLNDKLYVETNFNANSILNYTKLIFEKLELELSDIKYWLK